MINSRIIDNGSNNLKFTFSPLVDSLAKRRFTPKQYLAWQNTLPQNLKAGYMERIITIRLLKINLESELGNKAYSEKVIETFKHNLPKMLFLLLPFFALILKLLYIRHKESYYADHAVLSLHFFSFIFLQLVLCLYILDKIFNVSYFDYLAVAWILAWLVLAIKNLYGQGWGRTVLKSLVLIFMFFMVIAFFLFVNIALSALIL